MAVASGVAEFNVDLLWNVCVQLAVTVYNKACRGNRSLTAEGYACGYTIDVRKKGKHSFSDSVRISMSLITPHEELVDELPKLEKLSNAARLKHAKKRRQKQLKRWQEWIRQERATNGSILRKRSENKIAIEDAALLNDLVTRNDIIGGQFAAIDYIATKIVGVANVYIPWRPVCYRALMCVDFYRVAHMYLYLVHSVKQPQSVNKNHFHSF